MDRTTDRPGDVALDGPVATVAVTAAGVEPEAVEAAPVRRSRRPEPLVLFAMGWLLVVVVAAVLADLLPLKRYGIISGEPRQPLRLFSGEPLGTDSFGRSVTSRVIYGARASLAVGVLSTSIALTIGCVFGMFAGYLRGRFDAAVLVVTDSLLAFPPLVLLLAIRAAVDPSVTTLVVTLGLLGAPTFARLARANTMQIAQREFVLAARASGSRTSRVLRREILPNILPPVGAYAFLVVAVLVVAEGSLSFLGLGVPPPTPSWGGMIAAGRDHLADAPQLVFVPATFLLLTVFSFNVIGDWARRLVDRRESAL